MNGWNHINTYIKKQSGKQHRLCLEQSVDCMTGTACKLIVDRTVRRRSRAALSDMGQGLWKADAREERWQTKYILKTDAAEWRFKILHTVWISWDMDTANVNIAISMWIELLGQPKPRVCVAVWYSVGRILSCVCYVTMERVFYGMIQSSGTQSQGRVGIAVFRQFFT